MASCYVMSRLDGVLMTIPQHELILNVSEVNKVQAECEKHVKRLNMEWIQKLLSLTF